MSMAQSAARNRVYQDFDPFHEWAEDEGSATLVVMLPGFRSDQLKVQVTSTHVLRVNGEREVNQNVWRRFAKEFSIPPHCDTNKVSAKFERGMLYVKFPMLQDTPPTPQEEEEEAVTSPPEEAKAKAEPEPQSQSQPRLKTEPEPIAPTEEGDQQKSPKKEKEPISDQKEKSKEASSNQVVAHDDKKVSTNELSKIAETTAPRVHEKNGAKMAQRLKTRVLDFAPTLRSADDNDVNQCNGGLVKGIKRPKILMNIILAILLVMVLGTYIKNAFRSSQEGTKFQEF